MTPQIKACVVQAWWTEFDPWDQTQGTTHSTKSSPDHHMGCDLPLPNILLSNNHYNFERSANSWTLLVFLKKPWTWLIKILCVCVYVCVHVHVCTGTCTCLCACLWRSQGNLEPGSFTDLEFTKSGRLVVQQVPGILSLPPDVMLAKQACATICGFRKCQ